MKTILLTSVFILSHLASFGQNLKALDDKYGFREAKFEMPIDSFKNFVEVGKDIYISTTEVLRIGELDLAEINYIFYKGQLSTIGIKTKGYSNSVGFLKILQAAYGPGEQDNKYIEEYWWKGQNVWMIYSQNSITDDARIVIYCNKLMNKRREEDKLKAAKAAEGL